jgi:hypothetical protein
MELSYFQDQMIRPSKSSKLPTESFSSQSMLMPTGSRLVSSHLIQDLSDQVQMIELSNCGMSTKDLALTHSVIMKGLSTLSGSTQMVHALLVEALIGPLRFGILEARDFFNTTMHMLIR